MSILIIMEEGQIQDVLTENDATGQLDDFYGCIEIRNYDQGMNLGDAQVEEDQDGNLYFKTVWASN